MRVFIAIKIPESIKDYISSVQESIGDDLAKIFEAEKVDDIQLLQILGKMSTLSYLSTGNGKYLSLKGMIEI